MAVIGAIVSELFFISGDGGLGQLLINSKIEFFYEQMYAALIVSAVRTVSQGRKYVTPEIAQMLVESLTAPSSSQAAHEKLSDRELQTLVMIASGKRLSDIAEELMLSPKTVSVYRARVLEKLGLSNNSEMTVYAIRQGLVGES
jgi:DNA-binding NarL/FixJ family response regulator